LNDDSPKKAQRFVARRSSAVPQVRLWLSNVEHGEEIQVCIYDEAPRTALDAPENRLGCTSRDDLEIGSSAEGVYFYFSYGDVPYVRSEEHYCLVVKGVGTAEVAVRVDEFGTRDDGNYAHYSRAEGRWIHHLGYGDNQDMSFGVGSCDH